MGKEPLVRAHIVVWSIVIGLTAGISSLAAQKPPKQTVIKDCAKKQGPVAFPHELHVKQAKVACKSCHHTGKFDQKCSAAGCHAGKAEGKRPGCAELSLKKNPFHINCINCHKEKKAGPVKCAECHQKK